MNSDRSINGKPFKGFLRGLSPRILQSRVVASYAQENGI
jgi:hypothetical protein